MTRVADLNYQYDYSPLVLWQYSNANRLKGIIQHEQDFLDTAVTQFREEFDQYIFNLDTCNSDGLELWGKLLQVSRPIVNGEYFSDEQYRLLLKSRIYVLVWDGSCYGLTTLIHGLFPDALFRIKDCPLDANDDPQVMRVKIDFASGITEEQEVVLRMGYLDEATGTFVYTFLPRPAGVDYIIGFDSDWATTLGFAETIAPDGSSWTGMTEATNMGDEDNPDTGGVFYK